MCHTDEDDDLFENDPVEYIKLKYGRDIKLIFAAYKIKFSF